MVEGIVDCKGRARLAARCTVIDEEAVSTGSTVEVGIDSETEREQNGDWSES